MTDHLPTTADPLTMIAAAIQDGREIPIDMMERLMAMRRELKAESAREAYFDALADFQSQCPNIVKNNAVGKLYRYATLEHIVRSIRETEHDCRLSHRFETAQNPAGGIDVTCIVTHGAGHSEQTSVHVPLTVGQNTNSAQDQGIIVTYGMRYSLIGAFGLVTADEDTDARVPEDVTTITASQAADLRALLDEVDTNMAKFFTWAKVGRIEDLPASRYNAAVAMAERKRAGK